MPGSFEHKLQECQQVYLSDVHDEPTEMHVKTDQLMEGMFDTLNKMNQKVKSARQAYDSGGLGGLSNELSSDYTKQWNMMTPEQKSAYSDDFKKYEAHMKSKAMDAAHVQKADVHYTAAWQQVTPASRQKYFDNNMSTYAQAARAFENYKKNAGQNAMKWEDWLVDDKNGGWVDVKNNQKSTNPGAPYKREMWKDLQPAKQQQLTTAGWDQARWDAMVQAGT